MTGLTQRAMQSVGPASERNLAKLLLDPMAKPALVVAHPAHEIRVFDWMRTVRPSTYILTSGSRSGADRTRLDASIEIVAAAGANYVHGWGAVRDKALYERLLAGDATDIVSWTLALAQDLVEREIGIAVTDSWQYYNVAHDLTHVMTRCAAALASRELGRPLPVVDYPVVPQRVVLRAERGESILTLRLSSERAHQKNAAMHRIPLIAHEVTEILEIEGAEALHCEQFNQPLPLEALAIPPAFKPYYEAFGEERIRSGIYMDVIRGSHVDKIVKALIALV